MYSEKRLPGIFFIFFRNLNVRKQNKKTQISNNVFDDVRFRVVCRKKFKRFYTRIEDFDSELFFVECIFRVSIAFTTSYNPIWITI